MSEKVSVLIDEKTIAIRVKEIAKEISKDFDGENLYCVCVLKGALIFMADLLKHIDIPAGIGYMAVSSYKNQTESSGEIKIELDLDDDVAGKNVLLVEDIVDSGQTVEKIYKLLKNKNPKTIRICTMVDRPDRRKSPIHLDYVGFTISDKFLVGYGLDFAERYRNLPYIGVLENEK